MSVEGQKVQDKLIKWEYDDCLALLRVIIRTVQRKKEKLMRSADFKPSRQTGDIRTMKLKGEQMMD